VYDWHRERNEQDMQTRAWRLNNIYGANYERNKTKETLERWFWASYKNILSKWSSIIRGGPSLGSTSWAAISELRALRPLPVKYCMKGHRSRHDLHDLPCSNFIASRSLFITGWILAGWRQMPVGRLHDLITDVQLDVLWTRKLICHLINVLHCDLPRIKSVS
jgi:hypothetical protein